MRWRWKLSETQQKQLQEEIEFIDDQIDADVLPQRSKRLSSQDLNDRKMCVDKECQAEINVAPSVRKVRKNDDKMKDAIVTVSYKAAVSVPKARIATQVVCKVFYGHAYLLEPPSVEEGSTPVWKKPRTAEDYRPYADVLPSAKVVNSFKHRKALSKEV